MASHDRQSSSQREPRSPEPSKTSSRGLKQKLLDHLKQEYESGNLRYASDDAKREQGTPPDRPPGSPRRMAAGENIASAAIATKTTGIGPLSPASHARNPKAPPEPNPAGSLGKRRPKNPLSGHISRYNRLRRDVARFVAAGDAGDCGHERRGGHFTHGNTCGLRGNRATQDSGNVRRVKPGSHGVASTSTAPAARPSPSLGSRGAPPPRPPKPSASAAAGNPLADDRVRQILGRFYDAAGNPKAPLTESSLLNKIGNLYGLRGDKAIDLVQQINEARKQLAAGQSAESTNKPPAGEPVKLGESHPNISVQSPRRFVQACRTIFGKDVSPRDIARIAGLSDDVIKRYPNTKLDIKTNKESNRMEISFNSKDGEDKDVVPALDFSRTLEKNHKGMKVLHNNNFYVDYPKGAPKEEGFGTRFLTDQVAAAIKTGVDYMRCDAAGDYDSARLETGGTNGYYTWPRLGYDGRVHDEFINDNMKSIRKLLPDWSDERIESSLRLSDLMKTEEGRELWKREGSNSWVNFDLRQGSLSRRVLSEYRKEKGMDDPSGPNRFRKPGRPSRFVHAGDAEDCGHERRGGHFTNKNTCAGSSGRQTSHQGASTAIQGTGTATTTSGQDYRNVENNMLYLYEKAPYAKSKIDSLAEHIAAREDHGSYVIKAPLKSMKRSIEKCINDYGGDVSRMKDIVRNTITAPNEIHENIVSSLKKVGANVKVIDCKDDPMGYSGVNSSLKTEYGIHGEIQVNSPEMIFAKESPVIAKAILGEEKWTEIANRTGAEGGLGHHYYEQYRILPPGDPRRDQIEKKSRDYYNSIRGGC